MKDEAGAQAAALRVASVEPAEISLELERLATRRLPVRPVVTGVPAPGFVVGEVRIVPDQMVLRGPGSRLGLLEYLETTPVSVEGATSPVEAGVQAVMPDALVRPLAVVPLLVVVDIVPEPQSTPTPTR